MAGGSPHLHNRIPNRPVVKRKKINSTHPIQLRINRLNQTNRANYGQLRPIKCAAAHRWRWHAHRPIPTAIDGAPDWLTAVKLASNQTWRLIKWNRNEMQVGAKKLRPAVAPEAGACRSSCHPHLKWPPRPTKSTTPETPETLETPEATCEDSMWIWMRLKCWKWQ